MEWWARARCEVVGKVEWWARARCEVVGKVGQGRVVSGGQGREVVRQRTRTSGR